jgi:hypothetical protein
MNIVDTYRCGPNTKALRVVGHDDLRSLSRGTKLEINPRRGRPRLGSRWVRGGDRGPPGRCQISLMNRMPFSEVTMADREKLAQKDSLDTQFGSEAQNPRAAVERPLPGSTTGTIGGGGPEAGAPAPQSTAPEMPPMKPENIASGRLEPDPFAAANPPDPTKSSSGDTRPH